MTFLELAKKRSSVRSYKPDAVSDEDLNYVLEAGRVAPSAVNYQPWKFLVVREQKNLEKIHELYHRDWFKQAPAVIILIADHSEAWKRSDGKDHADIDVAIAADHMTLAATDRGLGTCWVCNFDKQKTMALFNLPEHLEPMVFLPLGHPDVESDPKRHNCKRKPMEDIVWFERLAH
jgi:nitroreductase